MHINVLVDYSALFGEAGILGELGDRSDIWSCSYDLKSRGEEFGLCLILETTRGLMGASWTAGVIIHLHLNSPLPHHCSLVHIALLEGDNLLDFQVEIYE